MGRSNAAAKVPVKSPTVADRRRSLRATKGGDGPSVKKVSIDLESPGARKALTALYPRPENDVIVSATDEDEAAALAYIEARDAATLATEKKEIAGNLLCNRIAKNLGVTGDGWKAEWGMSKGSVDWTALAKDLAIPDETIAKHRRPESRGLTVREIAEEG